LPTALSRLAAHAVVRITGPLSVTAIVCSK
jgi:hypothetical protein